jgi:hypothetical protein
MQVVILHPEFRGGGKTMPSCPQVDQFTGERNFDEMPIAKYRLGYFKFLTFNFGFELFL